MNSDPERRHSFSSFPLESVEELYEGAPCGYLSVDTAGLIVRANGKLAAWLGYAADELVGKKHFIDLLSADGKILYEEHFDAALATRSEIHGFVVEFQARDGSTVPALLHATQIRDDGGAPLSRA